MSEPDLDARGPRRPLAPTLIFMALLLGLLVWRMGVLGPPEVAPPEDLMVPVPVVSRSTAPRAGYFSPPFDARTLKGRRVDLEELHGSPVFMNFWAPWCGPCRAEMAAIGRLADEAPGDVHVLAVAVDSREEEVQRFVQKNGVSFPVIHDEEGNLRAKFEIAGLPTTIILDPRGLVVMRIVGARAWDHPDFSAWMAKLASTDGDEPLDSIPKDDRISRSSIPLWLGPLRYRVSSRPRTPEPGRSSPDARARTPEEDIWLTGQRAGAHAPSPATLPDLAVVGHGSF